LEDAIRGACVAELADLGYDRLTIESVATRAQTGKASIYRRWPTKQQLVMDSVSCLLSGPLLRLLDVRYDDATTTRDALFEMLVSASELMAGPHGEVTRPLMSESMRDENFSGAFECEFFEPRKRAMLELLARGVRRGEVRADAVDDLVVEMVAGLLIQRILIRRQPLDRSELERLVDVFLVPAIRP
jgi:AcrR family transcriptional regulator